MASGQTGVSYSYLGFLSRWLPLLLVLPDSLSFALFLPLFPPFISLSPMNSITR